MTVACSQVSFSEGGDSWSVKLNIINESSLDRNCPVDPDSCSWKSEYCAQVLEAWNSPESHDELRSRTVVQLKTLRLFEISALSCEHKALSLEYSFSW